MSEPKEYFVEPSAITGFNNYTTNRLSLVVVYRADDPAVISALKDSEDLATIKHLVGAHSVDEIKQWKRSHQALEKLEKYVRTECAEGAEEIWLTVNIEDEMVIDGMMMNIYTAPSLIEAIEQIPAKE